MMHICARNVTDGFMVLTSWLEGIFGVCYATLAKVSLRGTWLVRPWRSCFQPLLACSKM
ncbi:hypothetical protein LINGRAHAP2_LOCUS28660 [Linum grandiflorum]